MPKQNVPKQNVPEQTCLQILWCSLVEPTPVYPGGRRGNNSRPHANIATGSAWQGVARFACHSLRGGCRGSFCVGDENCCHGDRLGTQALVQLANTTVHLTDKIRQPVAKRQQQVVRVANERASWNCLLSVRSARVGFERGRIMQIVISQRGTT